ncbi:MAG: PfkB family carbohydrate kinase [Planctomycetes bacterium]|nr:PfkB family carbohydrate kinase [Planctomycetota bacterium]
MKDYGMLDLRIDILGLGVATVDDLLQMEHFPRINEKLPILSFTRQAGGLTGSALVAAARLGCRCGYAVTLGENELSNFLRAEMAREGISILDRGEYPEAEPYHSIILTEKGTGERSILMDIRNVRPPRIGKVEKALLERVGCIFVDHVFAETLVPVVEAARQAGTPVVGDFERTVPFSQELMNLTDHIILPLGYAQQLMGEMTSPEQAVKTLARRPGRSLACVTDGVRGSWFALGDHPEDVYHQPVFHIDDVVDTTGCGDVFHGVYAAGIVSGLPPADRIRRAAAAAALKTRKHGAQAGAPTLMQLEDFLRQH